MFTFIFRGYDCGNCKNFSYKIKASNKQDAINKMLEFLEEKGIGEKKVNYKD